jgi:hypothetical protein
MRRRTTYILQAFPKPVPEAGDIVLYMGPGVHPWEFQLLEQRCPLVRIIRIGRAQTRALKLWNAVQSGKCYDVAEGRRMDSIAHDVLNILGCNSVEITWFYPDDLSQRTRLSFCRIKKKPAKNKKPRKSGAKRKDSFLRSTDFKDE